jgi:pyruvate dehydrogenase E2 component (dihydrolipoamide acetyltransferase)
LFVIGEAGENVEAFRPEMQTPITPPPVVTEAPAKKTIYSPRARRFADTYNFHPASVTGSGPGGRVLEQDIRKLYEARQTAAPARISSIREKIAGRMRESLSTTAQYTLNSSANAGGLLTLRARIKASKGVPDININDLVTFCTIKALLDAPELNAEFIDGAIQRHSEIHIGFATDTPRGLLVPVVKDAHRLSIEELAGRMKDLAARAIQGNISTGSLSGATFTISNLGGLGIESFTPLLSAPQVAILGVGAIQLKPVRRDGKVEFADVIGLSLTCDHQVIDGAPGARFLQILREKIENVESLCTI